MTLGEAGEVVLHGTMPGDVAPIPSRTQDLAPVANSRFFTGDEHAIKTFLDGYSRKSRHTLRAYSKEVRRFMLWLHATRPVSERMLPGVTVEDVNAYLDFLARPVPFDTEFMRRYRLTTQPFKGPLAVESVKHAIIILHRMFNALRNLPNERNEPYCLFNPIVLARKAVAGASQDEEVEEALTREEWQAVLDAIRALPTKTERERRHAHRARWVIHLLYLSYLRRDEAANLRMDSFVSGKDGWDIKLVGKGGKAAKIIATQALMQELSLYRRSIGLGDLPTAGETRPAILSINGRHGVTDQVIYLLCKTIFGLASDRIEDPQAKNRLLRATPHWLRHSGISHAMEAGAPPRYVQAQARHASLNITARYDHKERQAWRKAMERVQAG